MSNGQYAAVRDQYNEILHALDFSQLQHTLNQAESRTTSSQQKAIAAKHYIRAQIEAFKQGLRLTYFGSTYSVLDEILLAQLDGLQRILEKNFLEHPAKVQQIFSVADSKTDSETEEDVQEDGEQKSLPSALIAKDGYVSVPSSPSDSSVHPEGEKEAFQTVLNLIQRTVKGETIRFSPPSADENGHSPLPAELSSLSAAISQRYQAYCVDLHSALGNILLQYINFFRHHPEKAHFSWGLRYQYAFNGHIVSGKYNQSQYQPLISLIHTIAQMPESQYDLQTLFNLLTKGGKRPENFSYQQQKEFFIAVEAIFLEAQKKVTPAPLQAEIKVSSNENKLTAEQALHAQWLENLAVQINQLKRTLGLPLTEGIGKTPTVDSDLVGPEEQWQRTKDNIRIKFAKFLVLSMAIAESIVAYFACETALSQWGSPLVGMVLGVALAFPGGYFCNKRLVDADVPEAIADFFTSLHKDKNGKTVNPFKLFLMGFFIVFSFATGALCYGCLAKEATAQALPVIGRDLGWVLLGPNGACIGFLFYYNCVSLVNKTEFKKVPGEFLVKLKKLGVFKSIAYLTLITVNLGIDTVVLTTSIDVFGRNLGFLGILAAPTAYGNSAIMTIFAFMKIQGLINKLSCFNTEAVQQNQQVVTHPLDRLREKGLGLFQFILFLALLGNTGLGQMLLFIVEGATGLGLIGVTPLIGNLGDQIITGFSQVANSAFPIWLNSIEKTEKQLKPSPHLPIAQGSLVSSPRQEQKLNIEGVNTIRFFKPVRPESPQSAPPSPSILALPGVEGPSAFREVAGPSVF